MTAKYQPGDRVRIRVDAPPGHFRTPTYIQGKVGVIETIHGTFRNPETLAYGKDGLPKQPLYLVRFAQNHIWEQYESASEGQQKQHDQLLIDIYEHWLEPCTEE